MNVTLVSAAVLGAVAVILHAVLPSKNRRVGFSDAVLLFLSCGGMTMGLKVCLLAVDISINPIEIANHRVYLFLSGLCVLWVAGITIARTILSGRRESRPNGPLQI